MLIREDSMNDYLKRQALFQIYFVNYYFNIGILVLNDVFSIK